MERAACVTMAELSRCEEPLPLLSFSSSVALLVFNTFDGKFGGLLKVSVFVGSYLSAGCLVSLMIKVGVSFYQRNKHWL